MATYGPLILILDDLHWADPASLGLLRFLARSLAQLPILVLVTYRVDELTRRHPLYTLLPLLERESGATRLDLRRLSPDAVRALVVARYRLPAADTVRLVNYLHARAEGNAFFTIQLLRALEEGDALRPDADGWRVGDLEQMHVPLALRQVIDGRLARLSEEAHRLLAIAAVIGHEAAFVPWAAVAAVDEDALLAVTGAAEAVSLMIETGDGTGAIFTHALVRESLYEGVRPSQRRRWHLAIAEVLAALPKPDPDEVAYHLQRAGDARAAEWLIKAGERAASAYAWATAADRFEAALALLGTGDTDAGQRGWLLYRLATLLRWDDPQRGVALLEEAARLAPLAHDAGLAAYALYTLGLLRCTNGQIRQGVAEMEAGVAARRALTMAERARARALSLALSVGVDTDGRATLVHWLATVGRYAEAVALGEQTVAEFDDAVTDGTRDVERAEVVHGLAQAYAGLGLTDEARRAFAPAQAVYRRVGNDYRFGMTLLNEVRWTLPFRADQPAELLSSLAEADAAWTRATGAVIALQPRTPRIVYLLLAGRWIEAREQAMLELETLRASWQTTRYYLAPLVWMQGETALAWEQVRVTLPDGPATEPGNVWLPSGLMFQRLAAALALEAGGLETAWAWLKAHDRWVAWSASPVGRADGQVAWAEYHRAVLVHFRWLTLKRHATLVAATDRSWRARTCSVSAASAC